MAYIWDKKTKTFSEKEKKEVATPVVVTPVDEEFKEKKPKATKTKDEE